MIVTGTTNLGYVTGKGVSRVKVTPRLLTISVGEIEFPRSYSKIYLVVISIQMVGDIETGNDITERGSVKGKKEGTKDRALGYSIGE